MKNIYNRRIVAVERFYGKYAASVKVNYNDRTKDDIEKLIRETQEAGYAVFMDEEVDDAYFNIEDHYFSLMEVASLEQFPEVCNSLKAKNDQYISDLRTIRNALDRQIKEWRDEIYYSIYEQHRGKMDKSWKRIPDGYIQVYYNSAYREMPLEKFGIEVGEDDVVLLDKVLTYIRKKLEEQGGAVRVEMQFYNCEKIEDMLPKE